VSRKTFIFFIEYLKITSIERYSVVNYSGAIFGMRLLEIEKTGDKYKNLILFCMYGCTIYWIL